MQSWESLSVTDQENVIGRTKLEDIEMDDDVKPSNSHIALNVIEDEDGNELKIVRANMPFGELGKDEYGTYFIGYSRTPEVTEQMLRNMFLGDPPGNTDRVLDFSTAVTADCSFRPRSTFSTTTGPARATRDGEPGQTRPSDNSDNSLSIGSLKGSPDEEQPVPRSSAGHRRRLDRNRIGGHADVQASYRRPPGGRRQRTRRAVTAAVSTGRLVDVKAPSDGVVAHLRASKPLVRLRVPFTLSAMTSTTSSVVRRTLTGTRSKPPQRSWRSSRTVPSSRAIPPRPSRNPQSTSNPKLTLPKDPQAIPDVSPRHCPHYGWPASTVLIRYCCPPTSTPRSARPPNTDTRSSNTSTGWSTATSSGPRPSTARSS